MASNRGNNSNHIEKPVAEEFRLRIVKAVGQICSTISMTRNLSQCQVLIQKAAAAGAKVLFLPEASDYIASSPAESISTCLPVSKSPFVLGLQKEARDRGIWINVGIHEPTEPPSKRIKNTLIWIDERGEIAHRYQKLHLFDIDLSREGGSKMKESDSVEAGNVIEPPFDATSIGLGHVGSMICFDLRFPEISLSLRHLNAHILLYPSAFTVPTGKLHWDILLRARAIECQSYVIASAQCGRHNGKRVSYGDTIVINPRGEVVGRLDKVENADEEKEGGREPGLLLANLELELVNQARKMIPLKRRTDVYPEL